MNDFMTRFSINCHSSIRCGGETVLWFDPFRVEGNPQDGDVIFVTHEHYDHFSPELPGDGAGGGLCRRSDHDRAARRNVSGEGCGL